jgi:hypothetical protein
MIAIFMCSLQAHRASARWVLPAASDDLLRILSSRSARSAGKHTRNSWNLDRSQWLAHDAPRRILRGSSANLALDQQFE